MQSTSAAEQLASFPFEELSRIESTIGAMHSLLSNLERRRDVLTDELDRATRPVSPLPIQILRPKTIGPGYVYRGKMTSCWPYIEIYVNLLRQLWTDFPELRDDMAKAMGRIGTQRTYVATERGVLFSGKSGQWVQRYSRPLVDGWFVDTNLGLERLSRLLPIAVEAAGLKWGDDVKVYWQRCTADS